MPNPIDTLIQAKRSWAEWKQRHCSPLLSPPLLSFRIPSPPTPNRLIGWTSPEDNIIKLNFDGSLSPAGTAAGYILRDSSGRLIKAGTRFMYDALILVTEATTLRDGLKAALDAGMMYLHIEGDNRMVIQAIKGKIHIPWRIQMLVHDSRTMLSSFTSPTIQHIFHEGNMATDWIVKLGVLFKTGLTFSHSPSPELSCIIHADYLGKKPLREVLSKV